jgi:DNA-directed RNA polymerase subunit RPC12/RpoP
MIALSKSPHQTAEWQCSRCGATNRKFVAADITVTRDRCVTCHAKHEVTAGARPVRWNARAL